MEQAAITRTSVPSPQSREHAATLPPPSQRSTKSLGAGELGPPTKEEGAGEKLRETKSLTVVVTGDQADGDRPKIDSAVKDGTTAPGMGVSGGCGPVT